jgi:hypothetical protein
MPLRRADTLWASSESDGREDDLQRLSYNRHMLPASFEPNVITIPYLARPHFRPFHASSKRFRYIVSHRRAGKSVALIVQMIIQCINNKRQQPPPKYAYVAPSFAAAKDLVWAISQVLHSEHPRHALY